MIIKRCKGWTKHPPHAEPLYDVPGKGWMNKDVFLAHFLQKGKFTQKELDACDISDGICLECVTAVRKQILGKGRG